MPFVWVVGALLIFRAPSMCGAGDVLWSMAGLHGLGCPNAIRAGIGISFGALIVAALAWVNLMPNTWEIDIRPRPLYGLAPDWLVLPSLRRGGPARSYCVADWVPPPRTVPYPMVGLVVSPPRTIDPV